MRVVHICKATGIAGAERHLLTLLPGLRERGIAVHMLVLVEPGNPVPDFMARWRELGIEAEAIPIAHDLDLSVVGRLSGRLRRLRPDLVHTHLLHADLYGTLAAGLAGAGPVVSSRHNDDPFRQRALFRGLAWLLDHRIAHYIAISEWLQAFTVETERIPAHKVTTVYYGLPPAEPVGGLNGLRGTLDVPPDAPLVAAIGRLVEQKGHTYLLDAFHGVLSELPTARLLVVGDGPLHSQLQAQAAALGIAGQVRFTGWRSDAARIMATIDVLAMPSLWEGFGLVTLEAMAQAKPVVASRVSALPEVVVDGPQATGWLVPPRDTEALSTALLDALRQPEESATRGQRGFRRLAEVFSPARMVDQTVSIYTRILAEEGTP